MTEYNGSQHQSPEEDLEHLKSTAKSEAKALNELIKDEAFAYLRDKREVAAGGLSRAASSLRDGANSDNAAFNAVTMPVADVIEQSARRLQTIEPEAAVVRVREVASANPAAFALGAAAIGFLAARFLSASTPNSEFNQEELSND
ncbi:hypothetical protein [Roseibium limicola]|uniref:Uncharacterized protein n=1 Tax=Roseibium limicola TaxID=2816037 RepID=A0A939ESK3_9HYPH|nr:hypothetical protein [Roseibium limicola]MBO0347342.1 hypothetical protein [Roseibium limicola]